MEENKELIKFPCVNNGVIYIDAKSIIYVESEEKLCIIHYLNSSDKLRYKYINLMLGEVESKLQFQYFFRCHKSYLINLFYTLDYGHYPKISIKLKKDLTVPLSRRKKLDFHNSYLNFRKLMIKE